MQSSAECFYSPLELLAPDYTLHEPEALELLLKHEPSALLNALCALASRSQAVFHGRVLCHLGLARSAVDDSPVGLIVFVRSLGFEQDTTARFEDLLSWWQELPLAQIGEHTALVCLPPPPPANDNASGC